jgi:tetratricopeptide (TPR) repeat protein
VLGYVLLNERRWGEAEPYYLEAIRLNPNNADAIAPYANFLVLTGRADEAVPMALRALRLNPFPPSWFYWVLGFAQTACGRYDDAIATLRRPETYRTVTRRILAAALALSGNKAAAEEEVRFFMEANPDWRIATWLATQPFSRHEDQQFWQEAYEAAGLPR